MLACITSRSGAAWPALAALAALVLVLVSSAAFAAGGADYGRGAETDPVAGAANTIQDEYLRGLMITQSVIHAEYLRGLMTTQSVIHAEYLRGLMTTQSVIHAEYLRGLMTTQSVIHAEYLRGLMTTQSVIHAEYLRGLMTTQSVIHAEYLRGLMTTQSVIHAEFLRGLNDTNALQDAAVATLFAGTNIGAVVGTKATATEQGPRWNKTVLAVTVGDANCISVPDGDHGGGQAVYTFPEGLIYIAGAVWDITVTNSPSFNADANDTFSFGAGTASAADDNDLTGTEVNLLPKQTVQTDTGGGANSIVTRSIKGVSSATVIVDGTSAAGTINVNAACIAANNAADAKIGVSGTLTIWWFRIADN
jgi:hypothetical protein